jgi:DNA-directed RNA polymerase sigma subunit (sigma70/sigma32)
MILRCKGTKDKNYGGRGIKVTERWRDFTNFLADMGEIPPGKSLDRIDNNGHYEPGNCRWATPLEQSSNQRTNCFLISQAGERKTMAEWAKTLGLSRQRIHQYAVRARRRKEGAFTVHGVALYFAL